MAELRGPEFDEAGLVAGGEVRLPQNADAERSVLSAMMLSAEVLQDALIELTEDDFFMPRNKTLFQAMRDMFDENIPIDPISLADKLTSRESLERVGGSSYLLELGNDTFALASWRRHAEMLRRDATLRQIIMAASHITRLAMDAPEDTKDVIDSVERIILSVTDRDIRNSHKDLCDVLKDLFLDLEYQSRNQKSVMGVPTGFPGIDRKLLGLRAGQMVVIGARPGMGKTSFALNLAIQAAASGASVAFFSLEMSKTEIAQRLLASAARFDLQDIRSARIRSEDWGRIIDAAGELSKLDIMIDDSAEMTVTEIRAKARRMLHGKERGIVILDYLQLVSFPSSRRADSRAAEVAEMSRGIKILAKDLNVPAVALSQLSRQVETRTGKRPQLSDLRESGAIEQDADIVILLDRSMTDEEAERKDRPERGVTEFIIAKNRSGPLGVVNLVFLPNSTKFVEVSTERP